MTPKTPAEQYLEVIEHAERMAKTVAAEIKRDRRIKSGVIPLPPSHFDRLREAMAALGWRDSATREDEIGLNPMVPVRFRRCDPDMPMPSKLKTPENSS
jgi:hypothetical protein